MSQRSMRAMGVMAALAVAASGDDLSYQSLKSKLRKTVARDPFDTVIATVLVGAFMFFQAEKDINPKVQTFGDALVFISTCLSVGYADVFARTETGKAIATAVMTLGPSISGSIFDPPKSESDADAADALSAQAAVVDRLDAILNELQRTRGVSPG